jgi:hypothetical protein
MLSLAATRWCNFIDVIPRFLLLLVLISLAGCNGGSTDTSGTSSNSGTTGIPAAGTTDDSSTTSNAVFAGSVGDGPVTGATVRVYSHAGVLLGTQVTDSTAGFHATVKTRGGDYPLRLEVSDGVDLVTGTAPDFVLVSLLQKPSDKQANINPFTTLMVKVAERLPGGLTSSNVDQARAVVLGRLGFGLDTRVIANPFTAVIDNSNVAQLVKASEALGEWVRRTRDLGGVGAPAVLNALAADLTDGSLDGLGASGTDARISAVANVVSSQVLVEVLGNHLRVSGVEATKVLDQSIQSTHTGISGSQLTGSVRVTAQLIGQSRSALAAALVLDNSSAVQAVASKVDGLQPDSSSATVSTVLPVSSADTLLNAVNLATVASGSQLVEINTATTSTTGGGTTTPVNHAPVIGGSPTGSVMAGNAYSFQPTATDADGNALTFSISGKPAWATFTTSTGRLAGVPGSGDVGSYSNIVIRVTDGTATASLAGFSINVTALPPPPPPVNTAPVISGKPAGSVNAGSNYRFQPSASDADGDTLTFSISGKPAWASFNAATGVLSGTPFNADAGTYTNIVISVSDGVAVASLPAFSIQVIQVTTAVTGSLTLNWTAPSARSDGSPLSLADIGGYRIYYGTTHASYSGKLDVANGTAQSATLPNLIAGTTYYLVMTTYDTSGVESGYSPEISKLAQ